MVPINLPEILPYFDSYERSGNGRYMGSCPMLNHRDSDPSVSITQDVETGNILMYCWGCDTKGADLIQALGLRLSDLFGDPGHPSAVRQMNQAAEVAPEDQSALEHRIKTAVDKLDLAEDYILQRFNLSVEAGKDLRLGVDEDFGAAYLIIPFVDPAGKIVAMQGRRLVDGEPRWRSVSGAGWSKVGCFGWDREGPVIITEGPSDALAVVGRANLPALAVRGASNTAPAVCEQIKEWLGGRPAIVIGDNGDAGEKFTKGISEGTGIRSWSLPAVYSDLCDYLADGCLVDEAVLLATGIPEPVIRIAGEVRADLREQVIQTWPDVIDHGDLIAALAEFKEREPAHFERLFDDLRVNIHVLGGGRLRDFDATRSGINLEIQRLAPPPPVHHGGGGNIHAQLPDGVEDFNHLPDIIWNAEDQLHVTEFEIRAAMDGYDGANFYRSATGQYVKVVDDDIVSLKESGVMSMLSQMGHWRVINGAQERGHVPPAAAKLISDPSWECGLPEIKRRVEVPFMLADGSIVSSAGYHEQSGVYLLPRAGDPILVPPVPVTPTDQDVAEAKRIFEDVTEGFVFKDHASKANLIAMTLTSPLRELFRSNPMVPMLTSTAPQSGSGKGTSIRVPLSTCGVGPYSLATTAYNPDENEFEKKLVGKLLKKTTYIFLDNIRHGVNSSVLEQMLTAANYDGRTLGYSEVNALSTLCLWVSTLQSTGSFNRDLTRRTVPVELIKNYKGTWSHKNIDAYLADMRGPLIWACFVVARRWDDLGRPISEVRLDGYGGWTECIGGMLEHVLGYEGLLENLESFRQTQDANSMTIDGVLERWLTLYGEESHPARMAVEDYEDAALHQMLGLHNPGSTRQVLNSLMRTLDSQRGHIIGNGFMWEPLGVQQYKQEGQMKLYRCVRLED